MTDTNPANFRRDREWYCPTCLEACHSVEQMQICQASHFVALPSSAPPITFEVKDISRRNE